MMVRWFLKNLFGFSALILCLLWSLPVTQGVSVLQGDGELSLYNLHSNEIVSIQYRDDEGHYDNEALQLIDGGLQCRKTHEIHHMSVELIELVDQIQDHFKSDSIYVISGYRSPTLNEELRKKGRKVAKFSRHMKGEAMDIRIPGVSTEKLRDYALALRRGGVGYYPSSNFVHVDVGPVRRW